MTRFWIGIFFSCFWRRFPFLKNPRSVPLLFFVPFGTWLVAPPGFQSFLAFPTRKAIFSLVLLLVFFPLVFSSSPIVFFALLTRPVHPIKGKLPRIALDQSLDTVLLSFTQVKPSTVFSAGTLTISSHPWFCSVILWVFWVPLLRSPLSPFSLCCLELVSPPSSSVVVELFQG